MIYNLHIFYDCGISIIPVLYYRRLVYTLCINCNNVINNNNTYRYIIYNILQNYDNIPIVYYENVYMPHGH